MLASYLSAALQNFARNRLYTAITVLALALGLMAAILAGVFVRHAYSYDSRLPNHERLYVAVQTVTPEGGAPNVSYATRADVAQALRSDFPQVETVARVSAPQTRLLTVGNVEATEEDFAFADPAIFAVLQLPVIAGDLDGALAGPDGLVLTQSLARKYFGRDAVVGQTVRMAAPSGSGGVAATRTLRVTAVIADLEDPYNLDVSALASSLAPDSPQSRMAQDGSNPLGHEVVTYVKLRPGADANRLQGALPDFVTRRLPTGPMQRAKFQLGLVPVTSLHLPPGRIDDKGPIRMPGNPALLLTVAALAALIAIAATFNFVSLMTARGARRAMEVGVRKALGASRQQLVAQFLGETLLYVLMAMTIGLLAVWLLLPVLNALTLSHMRLAALGDPTATAALALLAAAFTLAAGFYPAVVLSGYRPAIVLKGGPAAVSGSPLVRTGLVMVQFGVLIGLLVLVAVVARQTSHTLARTQAFGGDHVLLARTPGACSTAFRERLRSLPGVRAVACSAGAELTGSGSAIRAVSRSDQRVSLDAAPIDFGLMEMHGVRPIAGRLLRQDHGADAQLLDPKATANPSVVINESAARVLGYPDPAAAAGQTLRWGRLSAVQAAGAPPLDISEIVGVVPDFSLGLNREEIRPLVYYVDPALFTQLSARLDDGDVGAILDGADRVWRETKHLQPLERGLLSELAQQLFQDLAILSLVISICVVLALFIGSLGLFALAAYTAERRRKEMGLRKALGASTFDVALLLMWQFTWPVLLASLAAWPLAALAGQAWLDGFADRTDLPIWVFLLSTGVALAVAWITIAGQAWRLAKTHPATAMRYS